MNSSVYINMNTEHTSFERSLCLLCCCPAVDSRRLLDTDQVLHAGRWAAGQWTLLLQCAGGSRPELLLQRRAGLRTGAVGESLPESRLHGGAASPGERRPTKHTANREQIIAQGVALLYSYYWMYTEYLIMFSAQQFFISIFQNISKWHFRVLEGAVVNEMVWWISLCAIRTTLFIFLFCYLIFLTLFLRTENLCFWLNKYVIFFFLFISYNLDAFPSELHIYISKFWFFELSLYIRYWTFLS